MTGLYTRTAIQQFIEKKLTHQQHQKHAFIIIDIDDFKKINDNFGHAAGDEALISVSMNLKETFGEYAVVGRIGGDEFVVFIENIGDEKKLRQKLNEISKKIKIYKDKIFLYEISLSAGIAVYPYYGKNFETLYQHADTALYDSKSTGKGKYTFYSKKQKYTIKE